MIYGCGRIMRKYGNVYGAVPRTNCTPPDSSGGCAVAAPSIRDSNSSIAASLRGIALVPHLRFMATILAALGGMRKPPHNLRANAPDVVPMHLIMISGEIKHLAQR